MERALTIWIEDLSQRKIPLSGDLIQRKALQCYAQMKESTPSTSISQTNRGFSACYAQMKESTPSTSISQTNRGFSAINDTNSERALKFQRELHKCMSGYREFHKQLVKSSSQSLITDFIVARKPLTEHKPAVGVNSSSDKSDFISAPTPILPSSGDD
ncbi:Tc5 transposase DNA-binding domain [Popillia japonica]|uniref:Tc5 transposase DNA-binding domain n=1 Tax=Popillia japonica TaxID=7064 RepID=A0AAW1JYY9_POPJA